MPQKVASKEMVTEKQVNTAIEMMEFLQYFNKAV